MVFYLRDFFVYFRLAAVELFLQLQLSVLFALNFYQFLGSLGDLVLKALDFVGVFGQRAVNRVDFRADVLALFFYLSLCLFVAALLLHKALQL